MLDASTFDDFTVISGYEDGSDWIIDGRAYQGCFGPDSCLLWQYRGAEIRIVDMADRKIAATIALSLRSLENVRVVSSPTIGRIYVLSPVPDLEQGAEGQAKRKRYDLLAVDLEQRSVIGRLHDQALGNYRAAVIMPDGALLLDSSEVRAGVSADVITRIDPVDFSISESSVPSHKIPDTYVGIHWHAHSPDGRWWLRFDHTSFPMVEHSPSPGEPPRRYYGVTLQLWSAFPLRFERRIILHWLKAENLPDETHIQDPSAPPPPIPAPPAAPAPAPATGFVGRVFGRKGLSPSPAINTSVSPLAADPRFAVMMASVPARDRIYLTISAGLDRPDLPPDAPFPARADFGPEAEAGAEHWTAITRNLEELVRRSPGNVIGWEDGADVVWMDRVGFVVCAGMDGTVSPQLWSERFGLKKGMMVPFAEKAEHNLPLRSRKLHAIMTPREAIGSMVEARNGGTMTIDGTAAEPRYEPVMIPLARDGWTAGGSDIPARILNKDVQRKKVSKLKLERSIVRVPVKSMGAAGRAEAITHLAHLIEPGFFGLADDHEIDILFEAAGQVIPEAEFFSLIGSSDREWAVPVLRHVVERYVAANGAPNETYYQPRGEGESVLSQAVLRLAELDHDALPLVQNFGSKIDGGHEYFFAGTIVPAVIDAHGWTPEVIRFLVWVMIYNFYNTFDKITTVWRDLGLYEHVSSGAPEEVAAFVVSEFGKEVEQRKLDWGALAALKRELRGDASPWEFAFFEEIERLSPGAIVDA